MPYFINKHKHDGYQSKEPSHVADLIFEASKKFSYTQFFSANCKNLTFNFSLCKIDAVCIKLLPVDSSQDKISLGFDKKYFARKSLSFRNIFAILISSHSKMLKNQRGSKN